jgi:hypothetical protein
MHALDAEMDHALDRPLDRPTPSPVVASRPAQSQQEKAVDGPQSARHFSPDPMGRTDRYRLVTPYGLSPEDRNAD